MKPLAGLLMLLVAAGLLLAPLPAQDKEDAKKDEAKGEKKDDKKADAKKDEAKKDDAKKNDEKPETPKVKEKASGKREAKKLDPVEEKILKDTYALTARVAQLDAGSTGGITLEFPRPWPAKLQAAQIWYKQQLQIGNFFEARNQFQKKLSESRLVEVKTSDNLKVRTMTPPIEYDIKGNLKRWTSKELAALKGSSRLPGYPAQFDAVRAGQIVHVYIAKEPPPKRTSPAAKAKKKAIDDDDDVIVDYPRPEVLMIVVVVEAPMRN